MARTSKSLIKDRTPITERPEDINRRIDGGHWEGDLMFCRKSKPVLVLLERKSRFVIIARLKSKNAEPQPNRKPDQSWPTNDPG